MKNIMISYKDYIKLMKEKGYTYNGNTILKDNNDHIKIFKVQCLSIGKVLKLNCPDNMVVSSCGESHIGGCPHNYSININCYNDEDKEPFQNLHYSTYITDGYHIAAELVITKILNKNPNDIDPNYKEWALYNDPILKLINSNHPYEHVMWAGVYNLFSKEFLKQSFNLNPNEQLIFYAINPDIDITKVTFRLDADIFIKN